MNKKDCCYICEYEFKNGDDVLCEEVLIYEQKNTSPNYIVGSERIEWRHYCKKCSIGR